MKRQRSTTSSVTGKFRPPLSFVDCIGYAASSAGLFKADDDGVPWEPIEAE